MGKYDNIPPERVREALLRFALLVVRLERDGRLLESAPDLQSLLGDLRRMLFAHEVRGAPEADEESERTGADEPAEGEVGPDEAGAGDPGADESLRIVREALEREREFLRELEESASADDEEEEDER